jgi:hypothetical protein
MMQAFEAEQDVEFVKLFQVIAWFCALFV